MFGVCAGSEVGEEAEEEVVSEFLTPAALQAMLNDATAGPWTWQVSLDGKRIQLCGGVKRFDLTVMDFVRWGMSSARPRLRGPSGPDLNLMTNAEEFAVPVAGREHHKSWCQVLNHPDAELIEAAPAVIRWALDLLNQARTVIAGMHEAHPATRSELEVLHGTARARMVHGVDLGVWLAQLDRGVEDPVQRAKQ